MQTECEDSLAKSRLFLFVSGNLTPMFLEALTELEYLQLYLDDIAFCVQEFGNPMMRKNNSLIYKTYLLSYLWT
jgi:hypothetical protein